MTTVYDGHCHVASTHFIPRTFVEDVASNVCCYLGSRGAEQRPGRVADGLAAQYEDHLADGLVGEMDAAGIDRAVLLVPDFSLRMPGTPEPVAAARHHHEIRLRHPGRFWVYIGVDPRRGPEGVRAFEQMVDGYGLDGVKLYPPCGYSPSDPGLYPYYEICQARSLPVFVHTGPTARSLDYGPAHPLRVDKAARDFPRVKFVLGHGGLTHVETSAYLASYRPNVYVDTGGFASGPMLPAWPEHLNRLFRLGVNHKIIFGTDWPLGRLNGFKGLMAEVLDGPTVFAGVSHKDRSLLLHENLLRVLAPRSRPEA
ncbi:amidohydrolase family protein [Streptomyces sp. NPDC003860]